MAKHYLVVWLLAMTQGYFLAALGVAWQMNLVLIYLTWRLVYSRGHELQLALWGGWWLDVISATQFGFNLIWLAGFVWLTRRFIRARATHWPRRQWLILTAASSLLYNLSLLVILGIDSGQWHSPLRFTSRWLPQLVFTVGVAVVCQRLLKADPQRRMAA